MNKNILSWVIVGVLVVVIGMMGYFMFSGSFQCKAQPFYYGANEFAKLYNFQPFQCTIDDFGEGRYKVDCNLYDMDGNFQKVVRYVNFNYEFEKDFPIYWGSNATIPLITKSNRPQFNLSDLNLSP